VEGGVGSGVENVGLAGALAAPGAPLRAQLQGGQQPLERGEG
jgi:hypothetical protein